MKKTVSLFLVALIVLGLSMNSPSKAFSEEGETTAIAGETTTVSTGEETTTEPTTREEITTGSTTQEETTTESTTQPEDPPEKNDEDIVARIYLCSRWSTVFTTGHIWVYILNLTGDETFMVGTYPLTPGEGVSVATFGTTRYDGKGVYYNMEAYRDDKYCDESCISISQDINRKELEKVSDKIINSNKWNFIVNCVYFACGVWNTVADEKVVPFFYPPVARAQIKAKGNGEACIMAHQPGEKSFKQRGLGKDAYMENVCQRSLDA